MVRKQPVGEYLYKDTQLRKQRFYESVSKKQKQQTAPLKINYSSVKNEELAGKKLFKEYNRIIQRFGFQINSNEILSKQTFTEILFEMGFLGSVASTC